MYCAGNYICIIVYNIYDKKSIIRHKDPASNFYSQILTVKIDTLFVYWYLSEKFLNIY